MQTLLLLALLTSAVPSEVASFARSIGKDPVDTCKAVFNFRIKDVSKIDPCEKGGVYRVTKIKGKDCDPDRRGHYTLYSGVCQCNASKHSELHALDDKPKLAKMTNFANPCMACYKTIVKHLVDEKRLDHGEGLVIFFEKKLDGTSLAQHQKLLAACKQYKKEHPADFKR